MRMIILYVIKYILSFFKTNKTKTTVWEFNIDGYFNYITIYVLTLMAGILYEVKRFNLFLGISYEKILSCIINDYS